MSILKYINKYVKIFNNNDKLIASGKVISEKPNFNIHYISFDNKWFYGETKNLKLIIVSYADNIIPEIPPLPLIWEYWINNNKSKDTVDVYRDYNYDEIDIEIKHFIDRLNNIYVNLSTTTSCSGHGIQNWRIQFQFFDFKAIHIFLTAVGYFKDKLSLYTNDSTSYNSSCIHLVLKPSIDDLDFNILDKFVKKLETIFKIQQ